MSIKGFITPDNIYYESETKFNEDDFEVPLRPDSQHVWNGKAWAADKRRRPAPMPEDEPDYFYITGRADYSGEKTMSQQQSKSGVFENISWKDLITILYFLAGLAGMWLHMSERTLILEQKIQVQEKEIASLKETHKEDTAKLEVQVKQLTTQATELSMLFMRKSLKPE